jgi:hypothetical protein
MNYSSLKEYQARVAKMVSLPEEKAEYITTLVNVFFGKNEFVYQYDDDENIAMMLGFIPVQRLNKEDVINNILVSVKMNPAIHIDENITNTLYGLKIDLPQDLL